MVVKLSFNSIFHLESEYKLLKISYMVSNVQDDRPPMGIFFILYPHYNQSVLTISYQSCNLFKGADRLDLGLYLCQRNDFINSNIFERTLLLPIKS